MSAEDGGPAFPAGAANDAEPSAGISVRDYFAIKILAGIVSSNRSHEYGKSPSYRAESQEAYSRADAMLAARKKGAL